MEIGQQPVKSPVLSEKRGVLADKLISLAAKIEAFMQGGYAWDKYCYVDDDGSVGFLGVFKDLVPRTSHEACIKEAKYGTMPITAAIDDFFGKLGTHQKIKENDILVGIKLAREYYKVLITNGVINDHE